MRVIEALPVTGLIDSKSHCVEDKTRGLSGTSGVKEGGRRLL